MGKLIKNEIQLISIHKLTDYHENRNYIDFRDKTEFHSFMCI